MFWNMALVFSQPVHTGKTCLKGGKMLTTETLEASFTNSSISPTKCCSSGSSKDSLEPEKNVESILYGNLQRNVFLTFVYKISKK